MSKGLRIDTLQLVDGTRYLVFNEITKSPKVISGIGKLAQSVEKLLLTTPGTDLFNPDSGGGILGLVGTNIDPAAEKELFSKIQQSIGYVETEILNAQEGANLPLDEQLVSLTLSNVRVDNFDTINISILVRSKAGGNLSISLPIAA